MTPPPASGPDRGAAPSAGDLQASVQQDLMRLEVFREQLTALAREQELLRMSLESHARAQRTLEAMEKFEGEQQILVPVGAETYLHATPRTNEKVLLGIGHGIVVELERAKALELLGHRRVELEKGEHNLTQQLRRVEQEAAQVQARVQYIYQEAQKEAASGAAPAAESAPKTSASGARRADLRTS